VFKDVTKSLEQMEASFKSGAEDVKNSANNLDEALCELKNKLLADEIDMTDQLEENIKLVEKLSILNEYKLNLFKDFSVYNLQKK
tara:strand:+ start:78 stop:332 length:255 start_codon:yes stop_codon:yes gene_type:complete